MIFAHLVDGQWVELVGGFTLGEDNDAVQYPANWLDLSTKEEREAVGIFEVIDPGYIFDSATIVASTETSDVEGVPTRVYNMAPESKEIMAQRLWRQIKATRETNLDAGAVTPFGVADANTDSRVNIAGAVQMAILTLQAGDVFSIQWTMHDNTIATLDANEMIQLGVTVGRFVSQSHIHSQTLRLALKAMVEDETKTVADMLALDIMNGWPT